MNEAVLFTHEAMNTVFSLHLRGVDPGTAREVSIECFALIDLLESRLSRFIESSDVSRINALAAGETLFISEECHRCLILAVQAHADTGGLFDITLGRRIEHRKSGAAGPEPELAGRLVIHPDRPAVTCDVPGREIDLGGIGKGFALDLAGGVLSEWGIEDALITAGASSMLALGGGAWSVDLTGDAGSTRIQLQGEALSASGTGIQGSHIVHPGGPDFMPRECCRRVWVTAPAAAVAEVWSTALMLVEVGEMAEWTSGAEIGRVFAETEGSLRELGRMSA